MENNTKVKDLISKNIEDKNKIQDIEHILPTLTIFITSLPMESFSAEKWNTESEIPRVAIKSFLSNDVPIVDAEGKEFVLPSKYIPSFPVVVVKENIRVIHEDHNDFNKYKNTRILRDDDGIKYRFIDNCFDKELKKNKRIALTGTLDNKIVNAYSIFQGTDNWHRDHIYYGLSLTENSGPFNYDFEERITSFKFSNGNAYDAISDQTEDPGLTASQTTNQASFWTSGSFTFKFKALINGVNGVGAEIANYYYASPEDLFHIEYSSYVINPIGNPIYVYLPQVLEPKEVNPNLSIFKWNLYEYSTSIKISVEEVDSNETQTSTIQTSATFATNFSAEGTISKVGLKFGANFQQSKNVTYQTVTNLGSDMLGDCIINFADKIITGQNSIYGINYYTLQEYGSAYRLTVEPYRVQ